jgi:hypothetical protein
MKSKILEIEEGSKFFDFIENMLKEKKYCGIAKLKNGLHLQFEYVDSQTIEGKKTHIIILKYKGIH